MAGSIAWAKLDTVEDCAAAIKTGSQTAFISAGATAVVAIMAILSNEPVLGFTGWSLIDAALLAMFGWRMRQGSLPWTLAASVYWGFIIVSAILAGGRPGIVAIIVLLLFLNTARAIQTRKKLIAAAPSLAI